MEPLSYKSTGVDTVEASRAVGSITEAIKKTFNFHTGAGRVLLDIGYFANVIDLGNNLGLAIATDGVGTKILIAQAMKKYDTVGIDCIAMNVNDLLCVGAKPLSLVDYIAVETADAEFIAAIGQGLYEGAVQSNISIPSGEIAQVKEMLHPTDDGKGFDLVGTAVGIVPTDRILLGQNVQPGDLVVGLRSSGVHSNGFTLARRVLLDKGKLSLHEKTGDLSRTLGEELLEPTRIYVKPVLEMMEAELKIQAMAHITGDGLMNLSRVEAPMGFEIDHLPQPQAIFDLIQTTGSIPDEEMYTVFNMGVGFCIVIRPEDTEKVIEIANRHNIEADIIGKAVSDPEKKVLLHPKQLIGREGEFKKM